MTRQEREARDVRIRDAVRTMTVSDAARALGIPRTTLRSVVVRAGVDFPRSPGGRPRVASAWFRQGVDWGGSNAEIAQETGRSPDVVRATRSGIARGVLVVDGVRANAVRSPRRRTKSS